MFLTAKMMLDWLGEDRQGRSQLEDAVAAVIKEGTVGTYDVKGRGNGNSTTEVAEEVVRKLNETAVGA